MGKTKTEVLPDSQPSTDEKSAWVTEVHIHDHDGCYDLLHCVGGQAIGQYKRKMYQEGNYLDGTTTKCGKKGGSS